MIYDMSKELSSISMEEQFNIFKSMVIDRIEEEYSRVGINFYSESVSFYDWKWDIDKRGFPIVSHSDTCEEVISSGCVKTMQDINDFVYGCDLSVF